jgi:hypothetical protein
LDFELFNNVLIELFPLLPRRALDACEGEKRFVSAAFALACGLSERPFLLLDLLFE